MLAGGSASAYATSFTLTAEAGHPRFVIGENTYLSSHASTTRYSVTITIGDETWSYEEEATLRMSEFDQPFAHTDRNTLRPGRLTHYSQLAVEADGAVSCHRPRLTLG